MFDYRGKCYRIATVLLGAFLLAAPRSAQATFVPFGIGVETEHHAYVLSESQNKYPWTVQEIPLTPGGRMRVLGGPLTDFCHTGNLATHQLLSLAISPSGRLYVSGFFGPKCEPGIEAFAAGAGGNVRPILRIQGDNTHLHIPISMAFDRDGRLYVSQGKLDFPRRRPGQVDIFADGAHGNVAPIAILIGPKTQILDGVPVYVAVDATGAIFVAQLGTGVSESQVLKFAPRSHGDVAPIASTELSNGLYVNEIQAVGDTVYVAMGFVPSLDPTVYKLRSSDLTITDMLNSPDYNFIHAAADEVGRLYVQTIGGGYPSTLFVYPPSSNTPRKEISDSIGGSGYVVIGP